MIHLTFRLSDIDLVEDRDATAKRLLGHWTDVLDPRERELSGAAQRLRNALEDKWYETHDDEDDDGLPEWSMGHAELVNAIVALDGIRALIAETKATIKALSPNLMTELGN